MRVEIVKTLKIEVNEEEFEVIMEGLTSIEHTSPNRDTLNTAAKMRLDIMKALDELR